MKRTQIVLSAYYEPDVDPQTRAELRQEFVLALSHIPEWAMQRAFDRWVRTASRRPSPGEIVILAERELKPMTDELAQRKRVSDEADAERQAAASRRVSAADASDIMARAGFTAKRMEAVRAAPMSRSMDEAVEGAAPAPHWSEAAAPDDPRWDMLRASRAASGLAPNQTEGDVA